MTSKIMLQVLRLLQGRRSTSRHANSLTGQSADTKSQLADSRSQLADISNELYRKTK